MYFCTVDQIFPSSKYCGGKMYVEVSFYQQCSIKVELNVCLHINKSFDLLFMLKYFLIIYLVRYNQCKSGFESLAILNVGAA